MDKTLKIGIALLVTGVLLNLLARLMGPSIVAARLDTTNTVQLLALALGIILSIIFILAGIVTCIIGIVKPKQ